MTEQQATDATEPVIRLLTPEQVGAFITDREHMTHEVCELHADGHGPTYITIIACGWLTDAGAAAVSADAVLPHVIAMCTKAYCSSCSAGPFHGRDTDDDGRCFHCAKAGL